MWAGFVPNGEAHQLLNPTSETVTYLEIGDREAGDQGIYPEDDLLAVQDENKKWIFTHKDGTKYK